MIFYTEQNFKLNFHNWNLATELTWLYHPSADAGPTPQTLLNKLMVRAFSDSQTLATFSSLPLSRISIILSAIFRPTPWKYFFSFLSFKRKIYFTAFNWYESATTQFTWNACCFLVSSYWLWVTFDGTDGFFVSKRSPPEDYINLSYLFFLIMPIVHINTSRLLKNRQNMNNCCYSSYERRLLI